MSAWQATAASCRGSAHADGVPNQDAVRTATAHDADGRPAWIVAVADGHGGRRYARSETGARLAVEVAVDVVAQTLAASRGPDPDLLPRAVPDVVARWREQVLADVRRHRFGADETARAGEALDDDPLVAYGATLLLVVADDDQVRLAQIGDGDALVRAHGFARRPVPGDARLTGNETTSLCLPDAVEDFRYAVVPDAGALDLVLVATDGYGNSFGAADWWHTLVGDLAWFVDEHGLADLADRLPAWLADSAAVGGDDVTAVVLARTPAAPVASTPVSQAVAPALTPALTPAVTPAVTPADEPARPPARAVPLPARTRSLPAADRPDPPSRRPGRTAALAALAAVVLAAVAVGAVAIGLDGEDSPDPVVPAVESTTVPADAPNDGSGDEPGDESGDEPGDEPGEDSGDAPADRTRPDRGTQDGEEPGGIARPDDPDRGDPGDKDGRDGATSR